MAKRAAGKRTKAEDVERNYDGERRLYKLLAGLHYGADLSEEPVETVNNVTGVKTSKYPTKRWFAGEDDLIESEIDLVRKHGEEKFAYVGSRTYERWKKLQEKEAKETRAAQEIEEEDFDEDANYNKRRKVKNIGPEEGKAEGKESARDKRERELAEEQRRVSGEHSPSSAHSTTATAHSTPTPTSTESHRGKKDK